MTFGADPRAGCVAKDRGFLQPGPPAWWLLNPRSMTHSEQARRVVRVGIILVTLVFCARLLAVGVVRLASAALLPVPSTTPVRPRPDPGSSGRALGEAVLARNIFDAQTGSMAWDGETPVTVPPVLPPPDLDGELPACDGTMRLVAAMVVPRQPELSFASIADQGQTSLYKPGMQVGEREVVGIREQRVFLRGSSASTCQLSMFSTGEPARPPAPPSRPGAAPPGERITRQGEGKYRVARALFERAVSGSGLGSVRAIPQADGLKLGSVRHGSVLEQLGFESGDVLGKINGHDLSNPDTALEAYGKLRQEDHFSVTLKRAGRTRSLEYTID
jgi:general secretion pathway protein C